MSTFTIEKMDEEHIGGIAELEKKCFADPWSANSLTQELSNAFARFFVAVSNGEVLGYIGSHNVLGEVFVTNVAVLPQYRTIGVATKLIEHLKNVSEKENADFVTLEVRKSNFSAICLYEKCGFETVGERRRFYENPIEDALLMTYFIKKNYGDDVL